MSGVGSSIVCRASWRHDRCNACFIATLTTFGRRSCSIALLRVSARIVERQFITVEQRGCHTADDHPRQIRAERRRGERQSQTKQIVRRVANDALVEVANLDGHVAGGIGDRAQIAEMAVSADPDRGTIRQGAGVEALQPLIKAGGAAAHIRMRGSAPFFACASGRVEAVCRQASGRTRISWIFFGTAPPFYFRLTSGPGRSMPRAGLALLRSGSASRSLCGDNICCQFAPNSANARCPPTSTSSSP